MTDRIWRVAGVLAIALCFVTPLVSWADATTYTYSNVDTGTLAVASDGKYGTTSIQFVLSDPSTNHAVGDFPSSGYVSLTKISISARSDNNYQAVTKATLTNNKTSTSYTATVSYSEGNDFFAYSPTAWERKEVLLSFDGEVLLDTTATYTLAFLNDSNASTTLGYSVVRKGSNDWRPAMRISGQELGFKNVERTIAADDDTTWDDEAWTVDGTADQSFVPDSDTIYSVTVTVGGDCTVTMPESIGSFKACDVNFVLDGSAEAANVTLKYSGTFPSDSATTANFSPFGAANVTASEGITFNSVYEGDTEGYVTKADGVNYYVAKRSDVGVVSVRIGARTAEAAGGNIDPSYSNVGPYPLSGMLWNQTKLWNNNSTSGTYTDIQNLTDAKNGSSSVRIAYFGHNTYFNSNDATSPNMVLTKTYLDDSDSGNGDLTATHGEENITLPTPGHNRGWQLHFENIPYNAYDVYFITASDVVNGNLKETPIYVSLDGGSTWKSYCGDATNEKTVMGTDNWPGLPYAENGVLVHGKNYIKMRITKSIYGDNIGTIDITHGVRNTGSSIRSGLAAIQIVEVQNDGVYTLQESGNWSDAIWQVGELTGQTWTDTVEGEASIAKIESGETVASVNVDVAVSAGSVILTGSDPFTVAGDNTLTVDTGFDASEFEGELNLQAPIDGIIYIGANTDLQFGGDADMTLPTYTLDGAGAWQKVGSGKLTVNSPLALAGTVNAGAVEFTASTSGNLSLVGGDLVLAGGATELIYSGVASLADQGSGKTVVSSGVVQSTGRIETDIDVEDGAKLKLGALRGFGSGGASVGSTPSGKTITIKQGGTIELNGIEGCNEYTLAGGTLQNSGNAIAVTQRQTMGLTLTDDSTVNAASDFGLVNNGYAAVMVTLNGNTLTKTGANTFILCNVSTDNNGAIEVAEGTMSFQGKASTISAPVTVDQDAVLDVTFASSVAAVDGAGSISGSATLTVTEALNLAGGLTVAAPVALADGATITQGAGTISGSIAVAGTATVLGESENQIDGIRLITVGATLTVNDGANVSAPAVGVDGYILTMDTSTPGKTVYALALAKAKTGDTYYATVDDAFTALNEATDTSTILRVLDGDFDVASFIPSALAGGDPETVGIFWDETARTYAYAAATVNVAYFQTLAEALTAAKTAGDKTATLFKNNADTTIVIPAGVKLVLGDYTITATPTTEEGYVIGITGDDTVYTSITNDESEWAGGESGDWNLYSNWSTGAVPGANTEVMFPANPDIDGYTIRLANNGGSDRCNGMVVNEPVTFNRSGDNWAYVRLLGNVTGEGPITLDAVGLDGESGCELTIESDIVAKGGSHDCFISGADSTTITLTGVVTVEAGLFKAQTATVVFSETTMLKDGATLQSNGATFSVADLAVEAGASAILTKATEYMSTVAHTGTVTVPAGAQLSVTNADDDYVITELTGAGTVTLNNGTIALLDGYTGTLDGTMSITTVNVPVLDPESADPLVKVSGSVANVPEIEVREAGAVTTFRLYAKADGNLYVKRSLTLFRSKAEGGWLDADGWQDESSKTVAWDNEYLVYATINADEVASISIGNTEAANMVRLTIAGGDTSMLTLEIDGTLDINDVLDLSGMAGTIVKSGTGTFTAKGDNSGATLNWTVNAGMLSLGGGFDSIGGDGTVVTLNGGIVDIAGAYGGNTAKTLVIEGVGSVFTNSASVASPGNQCYPFTNIVVNANSTFSGDESWGVIARGYAKSYISIKDDVTFTKTGSGTFHLNNTTISGDGTLSVDEGSISAGAANCTVDNLQLKEAANIAVGSSALTVNNSFKIANGEDAVLLTDFTTDKVVLGNDAKVELVNAGTLNVGTWRGDNELVLPAGSVLQIQLASWSELEIELNVTGITADNVELLSVDGSETMLTDVKTLADGTLTVKRSVTCMVTNPVTGERVAVDYWFVGEETDWETVANWNRQSGTYDIWNALDGDTVPALTESGMFKPILVDGKTAILANESTATMEGYNLKLAALNKAVVEVGALVKIQGDNWIMADGGSTVTFNAWKDAASSAKLEGTLKYYLADNSKVSFNMPFVNSTTSSLMVEYYLKGNALVDYAASVSNGTHVIKQATIEIGTGAYKVIKTKPLVKYSESSVTFDTSDIRITSKSGTPVPHTGALTGSEAVGTYTISEGADGVYVEYIGYTDTEPTGYEISGEGAKDWETVKAEEWDNNEPGASDMLTVKLSGDMTIDLGETERTVGRLVVMMDEGVSGTSATLTLSGTKLTAGLIIISDSVTVVAGSADQLAGTLQGDGTIVYSGFAPTGITGPVGWTGTLWVKDFGDIGSNNRVTGALPNEVTEWGNSESKVKFTNVKAYLPNANLNCPYTLVLENGADADEYAWYNNNGWTANTSSFAALAGSGTFYDANNTGCRAALSFLDVSGFTGSISVTGKRIGWGGAAWSESSQDYAGTINIPAGTVVNYSGVPSLSGKLIVQGTMNISGEQTLSFFGTGIRGTINILDGATLTSSSGDAIGYNHTATINVYGTLALSGSTRWTIGPNDTICLYDGGRITGTGDGNGALNMNLANGALIRAAGDATIDATITSTAGENGVMSVDEGKTLTITGRIFGDYAIKKRGAGKLVIAYTGSDTMTYPILEEGEAELAGSMTHSLGTLRDLGNLLGYTVGEDARVTINQTQSELLNGTTVLTNVDENLNVIQIRFDTGEEDQAPERDGTTLTWREADVPTIYGKAALYDFDFTGTYTYEYLSNGSITNFGSRAGTMNITYSGNISNIIDTATGNLNLRTKPYVQSAMPNVWTAAIYGTIPSKPHGTIIAFGNNSAGFLALTRGVGENEVRLIWHKDNDGYEIANMTVKAAISTRHLYTFSKTQESIRVCLDGEEKIRVPISRIGTVGTSGFQVGNVLTAPNEGIVGWAEGLDSDDPAKIQRLRIYAEEVSDAVLAALKLENPAESSGIFSTRTLAGEAKQSWYDEQGPWNNIGTDDTNFGYLPPDNADVTITTAGDTAQTLVVELNANTSDKDNLIGDLTINGTQPLTLQKSAGGHQVKVAGKLYNNVNLTVDEGAIDIANTTIVLGENATITYKLTDTIKLMATTGIIYLTGESEQFADGKVSIVFDEEQSLVVKVNSNGVQYDATAGRYYVETEYKRASKEVVYEVADGIEDEVKMYDEVYYEEGGARNYTLLMPGDAMLTLTNTSATAGATLEGSTVVVTQLTNVASFKILDGITADFGTVGTDTIPFGGSGTVKMYNSRPKVDTAVVEACLTNPEIWSGTLMIEYHNFINAGFDKLGNEEAKLILSGCFVTPSSGWTATVPIILANRFNGTDWGWGLDFRGISGSDGQTATINKLEGDGKLMNSEDYINDYLSYLKIVDASRFKGSIANVLNTDGKGVAITIGDEAEPRTDGATISLKVTENALLPVYREISSTKGILVDGTMAVHTEGVAIDGESLAFGANGVLEISEQGAYPVIVAAASGTIKVTLADGVTASEGMTLLKVLEAEELPTVTCGNATGYEVVSETSSGYKVYKLKRSGFYIRIR